MTIRTSILMGGMAAAIALTVAAGAGAAPSPLYAGGSTLVEKVYRDAFNAYGNTASGDLCFGLATACPTSSYNSAVEILYVGVGSGNGLKALDNDDPSLYVTGNKKPDAVPVPSTRDFGPFYGTGKGSSWVPGTGVGPNFPRVSFSGSDNTLGSSDITTAASSPTANNPLIQIPGIVAAIAIPFNPSAKWAPAGATVAGASSKVQLSTNTLCGIFTGKITTWNNAAITKDNANKPLGTGTITIVYRNDSSGTTFLFTNALIAQCGNTAGPKGSGITAVKTKSTFPVPGQWLADNTLTYSANLPHYKSGTSFYINVFNDGHLPKNFYNNLAQAGVTGGANGSGGVKAAILANSGSIGYVSPDFVLPVDKTGPAAANLQTYSTFNAGTTAIYKAPTAANAIPAMASTKPPAFGGSPAPAANPLNWGAVNPAPTAATAYPISGFSFIDLHRCYKSATDVASLVSTTPGKYGYLTWYYGATSVNKGVPAAILKADGFSPVPLIWSEAILKLITEKSSGISVAGTAGGCKGVTQAHGA